VDTSNDDIAVLQPLYDGENAPGILAVNPDWAYVPPVRLGFTLNLDREETTCLPAVAVEEAERRRRQDFPIQQSNRYPSKLVEKALAEALAEDIGVDPANVLLGNGIMNILTYIYAVYAKPLEYVTVPTPGFWPAYTYAMQRGMGIRMPLYVQNRADTYRPTFRFPVDAIREALSRTSPICYLCNPNNPTGTLLPIEDIETLVTAFPATLFILDEAYGAFAANRLDTNHLELSDGVRLIKRGHRNVVVARTFSKAYALANHRIGYIVSDTSNITTIRAQMGPYDMSELSLAMAYYNYRERSHTLSVVRSVVTNMERFAAYLEDHHISHYGGYRNSLLVEGLSLSESYEQNGIAVRSMVYQPGIPNPIASTFRITIPADKRTSTCSWMSQLGS